VTADPQASGAPPRRRARGRRAAALIALVLGLIGFAVSAVGLAVQLLPRTFTASQQAQIQSWQIASRWQQLPAGQIFPATVSYRLPATVLQDSISLNLQAVRVGIAAQSGCNTDAASPAAAAVLTRDKCVAILRATYADATKTYVTTVGVAVLPSNAAAADAYKSLSKLSLTSARGGSSAGLAGGILIVRYTDSADKMYDYYRQLSDAFSDGPYVIMYAAGYADSRPRVTVADDKYSYAEMSNLAQGVARSVADTLGAVPPAPHCPGAPGC
jgi:hypothetical protein